MIHLRRLAAILCLAAVWLQAMAPVVAAATPREASPFVICAQARAGVQTTTGVPADHKAPAHKACDHCVLCQAGALDSPADGRPVFATIDFPVASPLRWALRDPVVRDRRRAESAKPRGPPRLV